MISGKAFLSRSFVWGQVRLTIKHRCWSVRPRSKILQGPVPTREMSWWSSKKFLLVQEYMPAICQGRLSSPHWLPPSECSHNHLLLGHRDHRGKAAPGLATPSKVRNSQVCLDPLQVSQFEAATLGPPPTQRRRSAPGRISHTKGREAGYHVHLLHCLLGIKLNHI